MATALLKKTGLPVLAFASASNFRILVFGLCPSLISWGKGFLWLVTSCQLWEIAMILKSAVGKRIERASESCDGGWGGLCQKGQSRLTSIFASLARLLFRTGCSFTLRIARVTLTTWPMPRYPKKSDFLLRIYFLYHNSLRNNRVFTIKRSRSNPITSWSPHDKRYCPESRLHKYEIVCCQKANKRVLGQEQDFNRRIPGRTQEAESHCGIERQNDEGLPVGREDRFAREDPQDALVKLEALLDE